MMMVREQNTEILIVGGGVGGCAAALAVARNGCHAILTEETDWIGGQLTSQGVPPDEHGWIESFGCTATYRQFRNSVRHFYCQNYPLSESAKKQIYFNPGNGWVSPLCHEPRVALAVLQEMLAPYVANGKIQILLNQLPVSAETESGDRISAVTFQDVFTEKKQTISAAYVLDATELGDLLPLAEIEFRVGTESKAQTGEPDAALEANTNNIQAMSVCFAVDYREGEDHTIAQPEQYEQWRNYKPELEPAWPGKLLDWTGCNPRTLQPVTYAFSPERNHSHAFSDLWSYRRILARSNFKSGTFDSDICTINWPMIDYLPGHILNDSKAENLKHLAAARQLSLSVLHWLQTEAPRADGGIGFPELRLRKDIMGTDDGLAKSPYIRESRRIEAEFTVCQQHLSAELLPGRNRAQAFEDSVGIGSYRIDLHPTTGGDNYLDLQVLPFQIPLGALIPVRIENLLPAAKNLGVTHITCGCYRLHPVEWNIGEVAGTLACYCLQKRIPPRAIYQNKKYRGDLQTLLVKNGIELEWPENIVLEEGDPHSHAK